MGCLTHVIKSIYKSRVWNWLSGSSITWPWRSSTTHKEWNGKWEWRKSKTWSRSMTSKLTSMFAQVKTMMSSTQLQRKTRLSLKHLRKIMRYTASTQIKTSKFGDKLWWTATLCTLIWNPASLLQAKNARTKLWNSYKSIWAIQKWFFTRTIKDLIRKPFHRTRL